MAKDIFGGGFLSPNSRAAAALAAMTPEELAAQRAASAELYAQRGVSPEQLAAQAQAQMQEWQTNETDARYGTDLSWLDPSFQYRPELLGQSAGSQVYADPAAIASQSAAMKQAEQFANTGLQFQSPAQQQALAAQWAQVQGGQGAPSFMGNAAQQALIQQAMGMSSQSGPGALQFDGGARQGEQYGNLQGIIAGGGADAIEMSRRQAARADSESWLRGQREADLADYAERGLTGSGMELLALSGDRQAAAQRNSMADLQTAAALEERRLGAINSAAELGTAMRGNTIDEQSLLNNARTTGLNAATSLANSMRSQDFDERSYLDKRMLDALGQQTDLSSKMRDQQYTEQIGQRSAQQSALDTLASTSGDARRSSAQEGQYRADATDRTNELNQGAINKSKADNQRVLTEGYQQMMDNRVRTHEGALDRNVGIAQGLEAGDRSDNNTGYNQGTNVGSADTEWWNSLSAEQRKAILGVFGQGQGDQKDAVHAGNAAKGDMAAGGVGAGGMVVGAIAGGVGAGSAAGGATAAQGAVTGAQVGSQALTQTPAPTDEEAKRRRASLGGIL